MSQPDVLFAPMEGVGTVTFRRVHHRLFPEGVARYYTPFLAVYPQRSIRRRDLRELEALPGDGTLRERTVPQILARTGVEIVWALETLGEKGFREVNLNLGCPSGTVVRGGRGAAMLADPEGLERTLEEVFSSGVFDRTGVSLSLKTRLGLERPEEFYEILPIFNRYPVSKIILHPRTRKEQYGGTPHRDFFDWAMAHTSHPLVYNGDLSAAREVQHFARERPGTQEVMIGRGLAGDPALARELAGGGALTLAELWEFEGQLREAYSAVLSGERPLLWKLKELWAYLGRSLRALAGEEAGRPLQRIRTAKTLGEYRNALREVMW